jgi:hypothetical protein
MASCLVVGRFRSSGIALDAVHRLVTEGMSPREVARGVLKGARPVPPTLEPELAALQVDPVIIEDSALGSRSISATARLRCLSARAATSRSSSPAAS